MKFPGDDCKSEELAAFLDFDSVEELLLVANKQDGEVQTCAGHWYRPKPEIDNWTFVNNPEWDE